MRAAWQSSTRREFLTRLGGAAVAAGAVSLGASQRDPASPPNIVLILADDLGYAELGCYGQSRVKTPAIDRLAAEGVRFTAHYSASPVCAPSRCGMLTGLHTGHCEIRDNDEMPERGDVWNDPSIEGQRPIEAGSRTIASVLRGAGYETALIGKWGLGGPGSEGEPNRQGFDYSLGYLCQRQAHNHYPDHLWRNGERVALDNPRFRAHQRLPAGSDPSDPASYRRYRGRQYAFDLMVDEAVAFVGRPRKRPFFLHFTPELPHLALQVPDDSLAEYAGAFQEKPYVGDRQYLPHRTPRAAYAAMVSRLDRGVGRIVEALKKAGIDRNTLVLFTSDNGATFQVGGYDAAFFQGNGPWRGAKQELYEGGIRVPLVAWWPGRVGAGRESTVPCASWDLLPTFAELAGAIVRGAVDGVSLAPLLFQKPGGQEPSRAASALYWEFKGRQAARLEGWKGIRDVRKDTFELYDLSADPQEAQDVSGQNPKVVAELKDLMDRSRVESARYPLREQARGRGIARV